MLMGPFGKGVATFQGNSMSTPLQLPGTLLPDDPKVFAGKKVQRKQPALRLFRRAGVQGSEQPWTVCGSYSAEGWRRKPLSPKGFREHRKVDAGAETVHRDPTALRKCPALPTLEMRKCNKENS